MTVFFLILYKRAVSARNAFFERNFLSGKFLFFMGMRGCGFATFFEKKVAPKNFLMGKGKNGGELCVVFFWGGL